MSANTKQTAGIANLWWSWHQRTCDRRLCALQLRDASRAARRSSSPSRPSGGRSAERPCSDRAPVTSSLNLVHLVLGGSCELRRVPRAVLEHESTVRFSRSMTMRPARAVKIVGSSGCVVSARKTSSQPLLRRHVTDVEHAVREVLEEDARLDFVLGPSRHDAVDDFAEGLVGGRQRDEHDVASSRRPTRRPAAPAQQAEDADAARLQGDRLAVGREPAERDQQADEQRNRDRDASDCGRASAARAHDRPRHALRDQPLAVVGESAE